MPLLIDPRFCGEAANRPNHLPLFVSLELSRSTWLITALSPCSKKMSKYSVDSGDGTAVLHLLARLLPSRQLRRHSHCTMLCLLV